MSRHRQLKTRDAKRAKPRSPAPNAPRRVIEPRAILLNREWMRIGANEIERFKERHPAVVLDALAAMQSWFAPFFALLRVHSVHSRLRNSPLNYAWIWARNARRGQEF
jgi:hypothetical protein